jgi:glycosyltransferase involved in cell wall biosynthesis
MDKRLKVLNVLPYGDIGGSQKFVLSLCTYHDKCLFDVAIAVLFSGGTVSEDISKQDFDVNVLGMRSGFDWVRALRLIPIIRRQKIDIVNVHGQNPLGKLCSILSFPPVIIHTDHGTTVGASVKRRPRVVFSNRLLTPFINHFVAISKNMKKSLILRERVPEGKITLIYNGVDVAKISKESGNKNDLKKSLALPPAVPIFGTVGRLAPEKQYPLLFEVLARLRENKAEFFTIIVGDGPDRDSLEALIQKMRLKDHVRFLGYRNDVHRLLEIMDVFLFSSGGEAFSITLLEAMAKTKPIVAFDVEGVNEAVVDNRTGFLVPFGDVKEFANRAKALLDSPLLRQQMGRMAFERVTTEFDIRKTIRKLEALYVRLMGKARASFK